MIQHTMNEIELQQIYKDMRREFARKGGHAKYRGKTKAERRKMTEKMRKALQDKRKRAKKLSTGKSK